MERAEAFKSEFLARIPADGSGIGNKSLRELLDWDLERYHSVREELVQEGVIRLGRGRGGSVSLIRPVAVIETSLPDNEAQVSVSKKREKDLYPGFFRGLKKWAEDQGWTDYFVEQIAHQGRRNTGGSWTRPDFVVVGVQKYEYTPGVVRDIETFEVKQANCAIDAVFEAAAHSRCATKSYLAVQRDGSRPTDDDLSRIEYECQRFGIGLVLFGNPELPDEWEYAVEPTRREPDPEYLEQFVNNQIKDKEKLRKWLR
jgi:hypothetical protein